LTSYFVLPNSTIDNTRSHAPNISDAKEAFSESLAFFKDVPSYRWNLLKKKVKEMAPNYNTYYAPNKPCERGMPGFFQNHYEPEFICEHERRIGKLGDGGKWTCDPYRIAAQDSCLVYSIGSNNDFSFETSVKKEIGPHCEIHTFDMGNYTVGGKEAGVQYHQYGLSTTDGGAFRSLSTIIRELGHEGRTIDIFKIDCEGCEYETLPTWFEANVTLRQIQLEIHTYGKPTAMVVTVFNTLFENGYVITHKEPNIMWTDGSCVEFAFLKLSSKFFEGMNRTIHIPSE